MPASQRSVRGFFCPTNFAVALCTSVQRFAELNDPLPPCMLEVRSQAGRQQLELARIPILMESRPSGDYFERQVVAGLEKLVSRIEFHGDRFCWFPI